MTNKESSLNYFDLRRLVIFVVLLYLGFRFLDLVTDILTFFATTILIALLLNPAVTWFEKRGIKRTLAAVITLFSAIIIVTAILSLAVPVVAIEVKELTNELPQITDQITLQLQKYTKNLPFIGNINDRLKLEDIFSTPRTLQTVAEISQNIVGAIFLNALALFVIAYLLANPEPLLAGFFQFFSLNQVGRVRTSLVLLSKDLSRWFYTTFLIGLVNGLIVSVGLYIIGVDFALVFGALLVIAEFIPYVGPLAIGILAAIFGLSDSALIALLVAIIFLGVQSLESIIWGPLLLARTLELHPVSIIFGILIGEVLLGIAGAILAVPALIMIKILFNEFYQSKLSPEVLKDEAEKVTHLTAN